MTIDFKSIQNTIGYKFMNLDLLQQAFVRRSYSEEHGGQNNEVLEFIGDKALDLAVIRLMVERFGTITEAKSFNEFKLKNPCYFKTKLNEGNFTDIKKDLVEKKALARSMEKLGFYTQLIMGKGDIKNNIQNEDSVKEDLFEAIIGAVTLDCDWDMDIITNVVNRMIDFDDYFYGENEDSLNYVGQVQEWSQQNGYGLPNYEYFKLDGDGYKCFVSINHTNIRASGIGESEARARMDAAKATYQYLLKNGFILNKFRAAVGKADPLRAVAKINELVQKKLITEPEYEFRQFYDENGNSVWECEIMIEEIGQTFTSYASSKKEAKNGAAYQMLLFLMGEDQ